jgi:hypothetical protein
VRQVAAEETCGWAIWGPMMAVTISREQRRAVLLAALDEVSIAAEELATLVWRADLTDAVATRRRLDDATRLVDDLGWETRSARDFYTLTLPDEQARRIIQALRAGAQDDLRDLVGRQRRSRLHAPDEDVELNYELADLDLDVVTACDAVLRQLDGPDHRDPHGDEPAHA